VTAQVSLVPNRTLEKEVETTAQLLLSLLRTKKPVVLVTTKNDEGNEIFVREAERLLNRKGEIITDYQRSTARFWIRIHTGS